VEAKAFSKTGINPVLYSRTTDPKAPHSLGSFFYFLFHAFDPKNANTAVITAYAAIPANVYDACYFPLTLSPAGPTVSATATTAITTALAGNNFRIFIAPADISTTGIEQVSSYAFNGLLFPGGSPNDGLTTSYATGTNPLGALPVYRLSVDLVNGTSNTLAALEKSAITSTYQRTLWGTAAASAGTLAKVGVHPSPPTILPAQLRPAKGTALNTNIQAFTSGGFNSLMADGSVRSISPNVSIGAFNSVYNFATNGTGFADWD